MPALARLALFALLASAAALVAARPELARLIELDDAQGCFHAYAPEAWNALSDAAVRATGQPVGSAAHLDEMARRVPLALAQLRIRGQLPPYGTAALQAHQACTHAAHKTANVAALMSRHEERAAADLEMHTYH